MTLQVLKAFITKLGETESAYHLDQFAFVRDEEVVDLVLRGGLCEELLAVAH